MKFDEDSIKIMLNTGYYIDTVTENIWIDDTYAYNILHKEKEGNLTLINQLIPHILWKMRCAFW